MVLAWTDTAWLRDHDCRPGRGGNQEWAKQRKKRHNADGVARPLHLPTRFANAKNRRTEKSNPYLSPEYGFLFSVRARKVQRWHPARKSAKVTPRQPGTNRTYCPDFGACHPIDQVIPAQTLMRLRRCVPVGPRGRGRFRDLDSGAARGGNSPAPRRCCPAQGMPGP